MAERAPGAAGGGPAAPSPDGAAEPVTLVLSLEARAGHERAFEEVPHRLYVTVLTAPSGGPCIYTVVPDFASRDTADAWLSSEGRARLVAEAGLHGAGHRRTRHLSGLEGCLAAPGAPVLIPPASRRTALVSEAGILPLLQAVGYLLTLRLSPLPVWSRALGSVLLVIPLMQFRPSIVGAASAQ